MSTAHDPLAPGEALSPCETPSPCVEAAPCAPIEPECGGDRAAVARTPRQARGQRRVHAILDAAAAIINEEGFAAATMHAIARRSGTTIGSMYHFFPDITHVLQALGTRHACGIGELLTQLDAAPIDWSALSTAEAVDRFVDPLLAYLDAHPELLELLQRMPSARDVPPKSELDALMLQMAGRIVASRCPRLTPDDRQARAAVLLAAIDGVCRRVPGMTNAQPVLFRELKQMLVLYLGASP